jgi:hypothetical protein
MQQTPRELQRNHVNHLRLETNGVKLDPFHLLYTYQKTLKNKHGVYETVFGLMRVALFVICPKDLEKEEKYLT